MVRFPGAAVGDQRWTLSAPGGAMVRFPGAAVGTRLLTDL